MSGHPDREDPAQSPESKDRHREGPLASRKSREKRTVEQEPSTASQSSEEQDEVETPSLCCLAHRSIPLIAVRDFSVSVRDFYGVRILRSDYLGIRPPSPQR